MRSIQDKGTYTRKATGEEIGYEYSYTVIEVSQALKGTLIDGEAIEVVVEARNRMKKVDANNTAREKARTANGDSTRTPLTPEEKSARKEAGRKDREDLKAIRAEAKAKGMSVAELLALVQ